MGDARLFNCVRCCSCCCATASLRPCERAYACVLHIPDNKSYGLVFCFDGIDFTADAIDLDANDDVRLQNAVGLCVPCNVAVGCMSCQTTGEVFIEAGWGLSAKGLADYTGLQSGSRAEKALYKCDANEQACPGESKALPHVRLRLNGSTLDPQVRVVGTAARTTFEADVISDLAVALAVPPGEINVTNVGGEGTGSSPTSSKRRAQASASAKALGFMFTLDAPDAQAAVRRLNRGLADTASALWRGNITRFLLPGQRVVAAWQRQSDTPVVFECRNGSRGPLCMQCVDGYVGGTEQDCVECASTEDEGTPWYDYAMLGVLAVLLAPCYRCYRSYVDKVQA